jgi:hypothetical protein
LPSLSPSLRVRRRLVPRMLHCRQRRAFVARGIERILQSPRCCGGPVRTYYAAKADIYRVCNKETLIT